MAHVLQQQRALEATNTRILATEQGNKELQAENETLSSYVDSLMTTVGGMGGMITTDARSASSGLRRFRFPQRKAVKVNSHLGELSSSPASPGGSEVRRSSVSRLVVPSALEASDRSSQDRQDRHGGN